MQPVLVAETLELLAPERGGLFVDAHGGAGRPRRGAAAGVSGRPAASASTATPRRWRGPASGSRLRLAGAAWCRPTSTTSQALAGLDIRGGIAGFLADLGVSSLQLETPGRGFSFRFDGPLDMRMGLSETTAADLVNQASEGELETIFREYGEERQARRIARAIARARTEKPIDDHGRAPAADRRRQGAAGGARGEDRSRHPRLPGAAHRGQPGAGRARALHRGGGARCSTPAAGWW